VTIPRALRPAVACAAILVAAAATAADAIGAIEGCTMVPAEWADGDSFRVCTQAGEEHTVRLYGADCLEHHVNDETDARRLRSQRRYFGIAEAGSDTAASIEFAKRLGAEATAETRRLLAEPFTLHTSFADGRGDARFKRIYGFVTDAKGNDLAEQLVSKDFALEPDADKMSRAARVLAFPMGVLRARAPINSTMGARARVSDGCSPSARVLCPCCGTLQQRARSSTA
jgi:endonuclease YncB( thermonuclease family)